METAIVGVLGALIGILFSNLLTVLLEARRRRERIRDVQTSLRAEIRTHWRRVEPVDLDARAELMVRRIVEAADKGQNFTPFIPHEDQTIVFGAVLRELHILPNEVIDPVVLTTRISTQWHGSWKTSGPIASRQSSRRARSRCIRTT